MKVGDPVVLVARTPSPPAPLPRKGGGEAR